MQITTSLVRLTLGAIVSVTLAVPASAVGVSAEPDPSPITGATIVVDPLETTSPAPTQLLGINHRYNSNGHGMWNPRTGVPVKAAVAGAKRAGVQSLRFPGGTIANTYSWQRAIGADRGCQVDGRGSMATGFTPVAGSLAFGPDEFMESVARMETEPLIMVSFVRETPQGAADWVEYMNTPAGDAVNPNGGVDWAEVRAANGHVAPYGVRRWEIGNEQHHHDSRHWLSQDTAVAAQEYAFGGRRTFVAEPLGKDCHHPVEGVPSDGSPSQVFQVMYPPVDPASVTVSVNGRVWRQVEDVSVRRPKARVYQVRPETGEVVFGDGVHGRVPRAGRVVQASYDSVHQGYFDFVAAMRAVDPSIDVCASFGRIAFLDVARGRALDCLTTHPISAMGGAAGERALWADALEGHDRMMLAVHQRRRGVWQLRRALPTGTELWFTEAAVVAGDEVAYPHWASSATQAAYMATMWGDWLELGIAWGMSSVFLGGDRAMLGPRPYFTFSAEALTREAIGPMFRAGGGLLRVRVDANPVRQPEGMERSYDGLAVTATRAPDGSVHLLVVNRLPLDAVAATIQVDGLTGTRAEVRTVRGEHFTAWNPRDAAPGVTAEVTEVEVDPAGWTHTFPATSTTVIRLPAGSVP